MMIKRQIFTISALCVFATTSGCGSSDDDKGAGASTGTGGSGGSGGAVTGSGGTAGTSGSAGSGANASGGAGGSGASAGFGASAGSGGSAGNGASGGAGGGGTGGSGTGGNSNFKPYFADDFESYANGEKLTNNKPFDAAGRTTASAEEAFGGKQSAKMEIHAGDEGAFGQWGGIIPINPSLKKGQEVWVRLRVFWPKSFQFTAAPWMKFFRLHNATGDGKNAGYNDLYVYKADSTTQVLGNIKEVHDQWAWYDGPKLPRDTWERYEMYLKIDDKSVNSGGTGRVRVWRDNQLIFNRTDVPTITAADGVINGFYLFTYWNNETPPNNYCYIDDLAIATSASPPPNKDASGNAYIGNW